MRRDNNRFDYEEFNFNSYEYEPYGREVDYYRKIEKKTTSGMGNGRYKEYTSYTNNSLERRNDYDRRYSSFSSGQRGSKDNRSLSSKQKYSFGGRIREKNNYVYYVSGIGYVDKNGEKQQEKREKNVIKINQRPQPIVIKSKEEKKEQITELIDNYQYHETKDLKKKNKETTVTHLRLCEPFYHKRSSRSRKRYSSYTELPRGNKQGSFRRREEEYEVVKAKTKKYQPISSYNNNISVTSNGSKYKYFSSKAGSQSTKNYGTKYSENRTNTYKRRNVVEGRKGIPSGYNSKNQNIKNIYQRKTEERKGRELTSNNSYNNIQRHEIKVVTEKNRKNKNVNKGYEYNKQKPQLINLSYNNRRNEYNTKTKDVNEDMKRRYDYRYGYETSSVECDNVMYKQNMDYSSSEIHPTRIIYQRERMVDTIPQHAEQVQVYQSERSQNIPQSVQEIEYYDIQNRDPNIPQQVQEIEYYERQNTQNIPQHEIEIYGENGNQFSPQPTIGHTYGIYDNTEENYIPEENVEQDQMYQKYQQNGERFTSQENVEQTEEEVSKKVEIQNNIAIDQPKEVYQEKDNQIDEVYEEKLESSASQENVKQSAEEGMDNKKEVIEENKMKQNDEYVQEEKVEITSQINAQQNEETLKEKKDNNNLNENIQQNEEMKKEDENKENIHQENSKQNEQEKLEYTQNIQKTQEVHEEEKKDEIPQQNIQEYQVNYEGEKGEYYNQQNNQQVQEYYQEERREYISQGDSQSNNYQQGRLDYIPSKYEERRRQFGPQEYTQISEQMYQEDERQYYPQQNIQQKQEMYQLETKGYFPNNKKITERYQLEKMGYIPQHNEDYYGDERNYYQQMNNKENISINGNSFINNNNGYISNNKYQSEHNKNMYSHKIYHTHEEMNGMLEDTHNYKFYESKNIKNTNEGDINSITLHHIRGEQKGLSNQGIYTSSSNSNYQKYQSFGSSSNSYYNYSGQSQYNSGFHPCPIHGNKSVKNIKMGYSQNY